MDTHSTTEFVAIGLQPESDWTEAGNAAAPLYFESLENGGDLTVISDAEGGFEEVGVVDVSVVR